MFKNKNKGFTIIELIVVIAIIAILAAIVSVNVNVYMSKSRDARRIADMHSIQVALELYLADNGEYPKCDNNILCTSTPDAPAHGFGEMKDWTELAPYLSSVLIDPKNINDEYGYYYARGYKFRTNPVPYYIQTNLPGDYILGTRLENPSNSTEYYNWDNTHLNYYPGQ